MSKKLEFHTGEKGYTQEQIRQTLNGEFELPKAVKEAKEKAFEQIRMGKQLENSGNKNVLRPAAKKGKTAKHIYKAVGSVAAAAALFSAVCITNPTWASNIPLLGNVFEELGSSLGFSGDYSLSLIHI